MYICVYPSNFDYSVNMKKYIYIYVISANANVAQKAERNVPQPCCCKNKITYTAK